MDNFHKLDSLLKAEGNEAVVQAGDGAYGYGALMARVENVIAVVSDIVNGTSRIFNGAFARVLGIEDYKEENSIWEKRLLSLMSESEQEEKVLSELRFYNYVRSHAKNRDKFFLMSKLRFSDGKGGWVNVLHRMYYLYDGNDRIRYAVCLYGPLTVDFKGKSIIVNSLTGTAEELSAMNGRGILSRRELQVLSLINDGMRSADIAAALNISKHTVSRHRQEIIAKLQVKNSIEACRLAKSMELL